MAGPVNSPRGRKNITRLAAHDQTLGKRGKLPAIRINSRATADIRKRPSCGSWDYSKKGLCNIATRARPVT